MNLTLKICSLLSTHWYLYTIIIIEDSLMLLSVHSFAQLHMPVYFHLYISLHTHINTKQFDHSILNMHFLVIFIHTSVHVRIVTYLCCSLWFCRCRTVQSNMYLGAIFRIQEFFICRRLRYKISVTWSFSSPSENQEPTNEFGLKSMKFTELHWNAHRETLE